MRARIQLVAIVVVVGLAGTAVPAGQAPQSRAAIASRAGLTIEQLDRVEAVRGLTDASIERFPVEQIRMLLLEVEYPDLARQRAAFRLLQEQNETGQVPPAALPNALRQLQTLRTRALRPAVAGVPVGTRVVMEAMSPRAPAPPAGRGALPPVGGLNPNPTAWTWLGPGNIGGRTRAIVFDPTQPKSLWAASVGGGVWHSTDGAVTFAAVDDKMANLVVSSMAMDPLDPKTIYAGTGEGYYNGDALRGAGVFRTIDGVHWSQLASTTVPNFFYVNRLALDPQGVVLLAATRAGIFRSASKTRTAWTKVLTNEAAGVWFHPTNKQLAIAGGLSNGVAYYSTNAGATWKAATHPGVWQGRVELAYARQNPSIVYASVDNASGEIWRSQDGGKTYVKRNGLSADTQQAVPFLGAQGWYGNVIWAGDPTNADIVLVGGVDLWKSTDGGNTLTDISTWWDDTSAHADHHVIVAHPQYNGTTNRVVYFGNDGGLFRTDDVYRVGNNPTPPRTNGWVRLDNGYGVTQFYGGAGSTASGAIVGGTQDNGTVVYTTTGGPQKWTSMFGGDGGWVAVDPTNAQFMYGEYVNLNVHRSANGGQTADFISGQFWDGQRWTWKPFPFSIPDAQTRTALFIAPFVLDPQTPTRMLAGGRELWRTNDVRATNTNTSGPRWASIKTAVGTPISTIAVAPNDSNIVWVGHVSGDVFRSDDATAASPTWHKLDDGATTHLPNRYVTRIAVDRTNPQVVYAAFGGFSPGNVWKTTDGGATWISVAQGLPEAPVRALALHPTKANHVYIGTEVGAFASDNGGTSWSPTNEGPTSCSVEDLFWLGTTLVAVTHGRGMFSIPLP